MNVAASKVSFGMHKMSASEASPCMRGTAGPPQELEFGARSAPEILVTYILSSKLSEVEQIISPEHITLHNDSIDI